MPACAERHTGPADGVLVVLDGEHHGDLDGHVRGMPDRVEHGAGLVGGFIRREQGRRGDEPARNHVFGSSIGVLCAGIS